MSEQVAHLTWLGWIVFAIVVGSVLVVIVAAAVGGRPRQPKVTLLLIGTLCTLLVTVLVGIWVGGLIFSVLMA